MHIQSIQKYDVSKRNYTPAFKSSYPVFHFIREKGQSSIYPTTSVELCETLQGKLVRILNDSVKFSKSLMGRLGKDLVKIYDNDYRECKAKTKICSFYNHNGGWKDDKFEAISYAISGDDAKEFRKKYGKPIGKARSKSPKINGKPISAEYQLKVNDYVHKGLVFVKDKQRELKNKSNKPIGLYTLFDVIRNTKGQIVDYELSYMDFRPLEGEGNPFVNLGYYK